MGKADNVGKTPASDAYDTRRPEIPLKHARAQQSELAGGASAARIPTTAFTSKANDDSPNWQIVRTLTALPHQSHQRTKPMSNGGGEANVHSRHLLAQSRRRITTNAHAMTQTLKQAMQPV